MGLKRRLVDVLITHSNFPGARGEVEMSVEVRVLKLIKRVVYTRKRVCIFTRNFIKATVLNAQSKTRSEPSVLRTKQIGEPNSL
jgi:hypothetical protein